jgi:hypothetical protein
MSARCYVTLIRTTYISECVWVIEMYQVEHGEGMCYDSWINKDKSQSFLASSIQ